MAGLINEMVVLFNQVADLLNEEDDIYASTLNNPKQAAEFRRFVNMIGRPTALVVALLIDMEREQKAADGWFVVEHGDLCDEEVSSRKVRSILRRLTKTGVIEIKGQEIPGRYLCRFSGHSSRQ